MKTTFPPSLGPSVRRGFTLVELLAVITILSILLAFLLPAVINSRRAGQIVQVKTDIGTLAGAIASFKQDFGMEPPSTITLYESLAGWNGAGAVASRATISRLWPQFDFSVLRDYNNDGDNNDSLTLSGAECLVFFLGGVLDSSGQPAGFSRNPANPFDATPGTNRQTFLTFTSDRLIPAQTAGGTTITYTYADPITGTRVPYLYASSNDGQGYNESSSDFSSANVKDLRGPVSTVYTPYYYRQQDSSGAPPYTTPYWNKTGYQIISAGLDRRFGGPLSTTPTPPFQLGGAYQKGSLLPVTRDCERDNITNFSDGVLAP